jgi:hypothetical protein
MPADDALFPTPARNTSRSSWRHSGARHLIYNRPALRATIGHDVPEDFRRVARAGFARGRPPAG